MEEMVLALILKVPESDGGKAAADRLASSPIWGQLSERVANL
jgi:hypothetical protein